MPAPAAEDLLHEEIYLALDDGNGRAGEISGSFLTTDIPIHCVVVLRSSQPVVVKMDLLVTDVRGVKSGTKVVSTSYSTKADQNRVFFTGVPDGKWIAGGYRADIFIDGKLVETLPFQIKDAPSKLKPTVTVKNKQKGRSPSATARIN